MQHYFYSLPVSTEKKREVTCVILKKDALSYNMAKIVRCCILF